MGTNLSGMEWTSPVLRYGASTRPNLNFTVPRAADVAYLASTGYTKNRLPIQWELLQPVLNDTFVNSATQAIIGIPGAFHAGYQGYITGVLDAHAAAGTKCIIDLHNYCRYQDFVFQGDGSVLGLTQESDLLVRPYTTNSSQVQVRIFATASGATLKTTNFADFWKRAATIWKGHPGLGGYGLMNEPHDLPAAGTTISSSWNEDLTIWPAFAQAAINAIRSVDTATPIYVASNEWDAAMSLGSANPAWPLSGTNLIYEVHMYLDAHSNGFAFDYDTEVAKNFSAGFGNVPIDLDTGWGRIKLATDWAAPRGMKLALTECGMPVDDWRWEEMFKRAVNFARANNVEVYTWMGGNHWPIHNYAINNVPGWHQNKTLEPSVSGPMKAMAGISSATLYDDGPGWAPSGTSVTITVYARGNLAAPVTVNVASNNGGTFSKTVLTIPAGTNGQDSYTYTSASNRVATLTYSSAQMPVPPARKVYSLTDPVSYASTSLADAAMALIAKYSACKWEMADAYTDYMQGAPAADGQQARAISDSGYFSSPGNAMEMLNWVNQDMGPAGTMQPPVARVVNGKKCTDHSYWDTFGFWCKKPEIIPGVQANPKNRVPYNVNDPHFAIAAVSVPGQWNSGTVFQASKAEDNFIADLGFSSSRPQATWIDANGMTVQLVSPSTLAANTPAVLSMSCVPGAQRLRVNSAVVGSASATMGPGACTQMTLGWAFYGYWPRGTFGGNMYSVITGKGAPSTSELSVMERYLGSTAGIVI
jgi:endoglucanase